MSTAPDPAAVLEPYCAYLTVLATVHLDQRLRGKLDPVDIVQQTFLRATAALHELRTQDAAAITVWLRKILAHELHDAARHFDRDKRAIDRERRLEDDLDRSASGLVAWLAADQTSPSAKAVQNEQLLRLADALARLPERMREVVVLKHCQGWTLEQIGSRLDKTVPAIASLLRRGLEQLRLQLGPKEPPP